jgi:hypothetical protein
VPKQIGRKREGAPDLMVDVDGNGLLGRDTVALLGMKHLASLAIWNALGKCERQARGLSMRYGKGLGKSSASSHEPERANYLKNAGYASL